MKKIILNENSFRLFKKFLVNEIVLPKGVSFCTDPKDEISYKTCLKKLDSIPNLRTDKYKDHNLENAYNEWSKTDFSKDSFEYKTWCGLLKNYMDYLGRSINFVKFNKIDRIGDARAHYVFVDPKWVETMNSGKEDYQGIFSLTLKIYQNKVIWNDLFFNPIFEELKNLYKSIRGFANKKKILDKKYELLLPIEEYVEIGKYMNNESNARPELFCEFNEEPNNIPQVDDDNTIDWG